jgi:hypothetical protein
VALVRTDVSDQHIAFFIKETRIDELGTTLAVTSNLNTLLWLLVTANVVPSSLILATLMLEETYSSETSVLTRTTRRNIPEDCVFQFCALTALDIIFLSPRVRKGQRTA